MKVIGINGSPRKGGNTDYIIKVVFEVLEAAGIETEMVQIGGDIARGCTACGTCGRRRDGGYLLRKAGAAVTAVRRGGAAHALDSMNHWLHYQQTFMVGSSYWNMVYCRDIGEAHKDEEGMRTMKTLGANMAYLLQRLHT